VPFGTTTIPILAVEHLLVCKALFNRPRDWVDIDAVVEAGTHIRRSDARNWMRRLAGAEDPRAVRLRHAIAGPNQNT
jgi:hypothetical protein